jgi:hypothetical protein
VAALKAAEDVGGRRVTATTRGFDPDPAAFERLAGFLRIHLAAAGTHDHTATCLHTLTPDCDLVLGPCPATTASWSPSAPTASSSPPCSAGSWPSRGLHGGTDVDLTSFAPDRPALTAAEPEARYLV